MVGNSEFQLVHELCLYVLQASQKAELIRATLATLHAFLSWIPLGYIFEFPLVCFFVLLEIYYNIACINFALLKPDNLSIYVLNCLSASDGFVCAFTRKFIFTILKHLGLLLFTD